MITKKIVKVSATVVAAFLCSIAFAQSAGDGKTLQTLLGKSTESPEVKNLETSYHCDLSDPSHCVSPNDGLELMIKNGVLSEIRLYKSSAVYGQFKGNLPKALKFGMSSSEVKALLGKPTVSYNSSGYCEFVLEGTVFACGFDNGKLSQLTLSLR